MVECCQYLISFCARENAVSALARVRSELRWCLESSIDSEVDLIASASTGNVDGSDHGIDVIETNIGRTEESEGRELLHSS